MKYFFILLYLCGCNKHIVSTILTDAPKVLTVHFQEKFNNDVISMKIGKHAVITNWPLYSDPVDEFASSKIEVYELPKDFAVVRTRKGFQTDTIFCKAIMTDSVSIKIHFNGIERAFGFKLKLGRNIGIGKVNADSLRIEQSSRPFYYN